jgi:general secretion pathway protein N
MTARRWLMLLGVLAGLASLIWLMPLSVAVAIAGIDRMGITAKGADGTVWNGRMRQAAVNGAPVGDIGLSLSPLALLTGEIRLKGLTLPDAASQGTLVRSFSGWGVDSVTAQLPVSQNYGPLVATGLRLENVTFRTAGAKCVDASGTVALTLAGNAAILPKAETLTGPLRCDGEGVRLRLTDPSAARRVTVTVRSDGVYSGTLTIATSDEQLRLLLSTGGFTDSSEGLTMRFEGRI